MNMDKSILNFMLLTEHDVVFPSQLNKSLGALNLLLDWLQISPRFQVKLPCSYQVSLLSSTFHRHRLERNQIFLSCSLSDTNLGTQILKLSFFGLQLDPFCSSIYAYV